MGYDVVKSGLPQSAFPAGGQTAVHALDTATGAEWTTLPQSGWQPISSSFALTNVLGVTALQAGLLVFTAPVSGLYQIYAAVIQSTATGTTTGAVSVAYTDSDTGAVVAATSFVSAVALAAQGAAAQGLITIDVKAGTTVTVSSAVVSGSGGAVNIKTRAAFLG